MSANNASVFRKQAEGSRSRLTRPAARTCLTASWSVATVLPVDRPGEKLAPRQQRFARMMRSYVCGVALVVRNAEHLQIGPAYRTPQKEQAYERRAAAVQHVCRLNRRRGQIIDGYRFHTEAP